MLAGAPLGLVQSSRRGGEGAWRLSKCPPVTRAARQGPSRRHPPLTAGTLQRANTPFPCLPHWQWRRGPNPRLSDLGLQALTVAGLSKGRRSEEAHLSVFSPRRPYLIFPGATPFVLGLSPANNAPVQYCTNTSRIRRVSGQSAPARPSRRDGRRARR